MNNITPILLPVKYRELVYPFVERQTFYQGYTIHEDEALKEVNDLELLKVWINLRYGISNIDLSKINIFKYVYPDNNAKRYWTGYVLCYGDKDEWKRHERIPEKNYYFVLSPEQAIKLSQYYNECKKPFYYNYWFIYIYILLGIIIITVFYYVNVLQAI